MHTHSNAFEQARHLLADEGVPLSDEQCDRLRQHAALVRRWNDYVSLVSLGDLDQVLDRHTADALSLVGLLAPGVAAGVPLYDLGSGGGFPAIPLKVALPDLRLTLVDRSGKKAGVLRNMVVELGLVDVEVVQGVFPGGVRLPGPVMVTARAIEKPGTVNTALADALPVGGIFWCPSGDTAAFDGSRYRVTCVEDTWTEEGLRRGSLHRVERVA